MPSRMELEFGPEWERLAETLGRAAIRDVLVAGLLVTANEYVADAARAAPHVTGRLRASIRAGTPQQDGDTVMVAVVATTNYARAVEEGARPRVIRPRRAKVLAFRKAGRKRKVFARQVNWPGFRGRWYFRDTMRANVDKYARTFRAYSYAMVLRRLGLSL